ncbi:hypothetical protein AAF712_012934 [Marasmius tenuissimus]|uniref:G-protein coupled receptors family 2 profile 2 domain-containing protein n=1 Tax=Marasmius tenuissimus TaxID=585030 RepID=A0ABR2ZH48_9AGAR
MARLVVFHGIYGKRSEKFYIIGSAVLTCAVTIPPYAANQYGWDVLEQTCWYTNINKGQRIAWQVGSQVAWTFLTGIGEIICSVVVLAFLLRHNLKFRRVFTPTITSTIQGSHITRGTAPRVIQATRYKSIIIRVALYPMASCVVNLLSIATVLHSSFSYGIHDTTDYKVLLLSDFLYGGRAIVYGLLAATDPALIRGVKSFVRLSRGSFGFDTSSENSTSVGSSDPNGVAVHIEFASFQSSLTGPPPPLKHRDSKVRPTDSSNATLRGDVEAPAPSTRDIHLNRCVEGPENCQPSFAPSSRPAAGEQRRRSGREMMEEDSFEKEL